MSAIVEIGVACPDIQTARDIARALLAEKLAACCNIGQPLDSRYWWKGQIERADEWPLLVKTRAELFEEAAAAIRRLHPYETPAIFGQAVSHADEATRNWIIEVTKTT